jgi:hypothetical protein
MTHTLAALPRDARIELLYPGEMGMAVANLLRHDCRVVTTLAGRGANTYGVENRLLHLGLCPTVVQGIRQLTEAVAKCSLPGGQGKPWTVPEVVEELHAQGVLKPRAESSSPGPVAPLLS